MKVLEGADAVMEEVAGWQLSSDEELEHEEEHGDRGRSGLSSRILFSIIDGVRPPALGGSNLYRGLLRSGSVPPSPDAHRDVAPDRAFIGRKDHRSLWPKFLHAVNGRGQNSYLRLSTTWGKAHSNAMAMCYSHGDVCKRSRSLLHERPMGELWAWLHYGMRPNVTSQAAHAAYFPISAERAAARLEFEAGGADVQQFLAAECGGVGFGEPEQNRHSDV